MLDLEALVTDMHRLAGDLAASTRDSARRRDRAVDQLAKAREMAQLREAIRKFGQNMARPADGLDMGEIYAAPPAQDYTVIATDGSQIAPDFHQLAPWYALNTGVVVFRYGAPPGRKRASIRSFPELRPPLRGASSASEVGDESSGPDQNADARGATPTAGPRIEVERLKAELHHATAVLDSEGDPERTVLLLDGPLIQWRMLTDLKGEERRAVVKAFQELLARSRKRGVAVAGYISRSRAVEWITLLRASLCPEISVTGQLCAACRKTLLKWNVEPPAGAHHAPLAGVKDIDLTARLLPGKGWRTELLELQSEVWEEVMGKDACAGFFYIHAGSELARVELPEWVWKDARQLELLHAVVSDQCEVGHGYPMVLSEAHEAAVVRAPDRNAFYALMERVLANYDGPEPAISAKALSKRRPLA